MRVKDEVAQETEDICLDDKTLFDIIKPCIDKAFFKGISKEQREAVTKFLSK